MQRLFHTSTFSQCYARSKEQLQAAAVLTNLAYLTHCADRALVPGMVLGPVKGALLVCGAAIDGRVAGGADLELGELVELDLDRVARVVLALCLDFTCLRDELSAWSLEHKQGVYN